MDQHRSYHNHDGDLPPPYESSQFPPSTSIPLEPPEKNLYPQPYVYAARSNVSELPPSNSHAPFQSDPSGGQRHNEPDYVNNFNAVCDPITWLSLAYILFVSLPIACLGFMWVWTTFMMSVLLLIIPPVGLLMLSFSFYSYRMLGQIELVTLELFFGRPPTHKERRYPRVFPSDRPLTRNEILYPIVAKDKWTLWCTLYFALIKLFMSISTFTVAMSVLPLILVFVCFFPLGAVFLRNIGLGQRDFAFRCLDFEK
ncbi:uncharacterized protein VTP21DRAFT_5607 [Calcarisporiella thermophila]|uniref:uncharacterized protein n=1 Tax=Calcarisporiella thermophila TaxID=911321 RepID=UPI00374340A9